MEEVIKDILSTRDNNMLKCKKNPVTGRQMVDILSRQFSLFSFAKPYNFSEPSIFGKKLIGEGELFGGDINAAI